MVPHDRRRAEAERPPPLLELPAHVDIVPRGPEPGVEPADRPQRLAPEGHVAARDVLRFPVGEEHVRRTAGRVRHAVGDRSVAGRGDVRPSDRDVCGGEERVDEIVEPVRVGIGVVIEVGDDLAGRRLEAGVPGRREPPVLRLDEPQVVFAGDGRGVVGRAVVDDDHLEVRVVQLRETVEAVANRPAAVVAADDDRDERPAPGRRKRGLGVGRPHGAQGRLRLAALVRQAELPVVHVLARPVPLVGPGKNERARTARGERRAHLPVEHVRLCLLAVAEAVEAELAQHERAIARQVVQAGKVGLEAIARLEIDVEAHEVEERQPQVLGGRVVDVRDEAVRILRLHDPGEPLEIALDPPRPEPAHDLGRDLVAERVAEERGMARTGAHLGPHDLCDVGRAPPVDQEADVLLGRETDHDAQTMLRGEIEQRARRHGVGDPYRVDPVGRHLREIGVDRFQVAVFLVVLVGPEGAVGDAADVEGRVAHEEELATHLGPGTLRGARQGFRREPVVSCSGACRDGFHQLPTPANGSRPPLPGGCSQNLTSRRRPPPKQEMCP